MSPRKDDPALLEFVSAGAAMRAVQSARAERMLAHFDALDRALVAKGFPATSAWWRETIEGFYREHRRQLVLRVGRRGGKSSTLCRIAVLEALFGEHVIPPGDVGIVAFVSVSRDEAARRLVTIRAILDALGVRYAERGETIELLDRPIAFRVFTASLSGVVGGTIIVAVCDEVARWRDSDTGANPAREVLTSLRPSLAGHANAKIFLISSPWGIDDAHARAFDEGNTEFQSVAHAPTWIARPSLTEAECRALEPAESAFLREYAAIPSADVDESLYPSAALDLVTRAAPLELASGKHALAAIDPATRGNAWSLVVAVPDGPIVRIALVREWRGSRGQPLSPETTFKEIAAILEPFDVREVLSDQWAFDANRDLARQVGLHLSLRTITQVTRLTMFERLRAMVNQQTIELPPHEQLRRDLLGVRKRLQPGGSFSVVLPETGDGRHADLAAGLALVASELAGGGPVDWAPAIAAMHRATAQHQRSGRYFGSGRGF